jgi:hypothetical protein
MRAHRYRITISGGLGEILREAFADLDIAPDGPNTVLTGDLDQALGLEFVEVQSGR